MWGLPWRSSGQDSVLLLQGVQVQPLVRELRFRMLPSMAKITKQNKKECLQVYSELLSLETLQA